MNAALNKRGRAYMCRRCKAAGVSLVDRRGRLMGHILKHHIPLDQVPYSCSLCMFKAMDKKSLLGHVTKYARHVRLARDIGVIDNSQYLAMSTNPAVVGEADMIMLNQEESARQFGHRATAVEDPLGIDEWESDEETLPLRPVSAFPRSSRNMVITPAVRATPAVSLAATRVWDGGIPTFDALAFQVLPTTATVTRTTCQKSPSTHSITTSSMSAAANGVYMVPASHWSQSATASTMIHPVTMPVPGTPGPVESSTLGRYRKRTPDSTPLQDEGVSFLNELLGATDVQDQLHLEIHGQGAGLNASLPSEPTKRSAPSSSAEESSKKAKPDNEPYSALVKAIEQASTGIVDAIDRNTRAVRARDEALTKVVAELEHMSLVISRTHGRDDRDRLETRVATESRGKENRPKSVVLKKK